MKNLTQRLLYAVMLFCGLFVLSGVSKAGNFPRNSQLYFQPKSGWTDAGAKFVAKFGSDATEHTLTKVDGESMLYEFTVPNADFDKVHIIRQNPANGEQWNYLSNISASAGYNLIIMGDAWDADSSNYTWGNYNAVIDPANYTYQLEYWTPGGSDNATEALTPNVAISKTGVAGKNFGIRLKYKGSDKGWYSCPTGESYTIVDGEKAYPLAEVNNNYLLPSFTGSYSFTLKVDEDGIPSAIVVKTPKVPTYLYFVSDAFTSTTPVRMLKDGKKFSFKFKAAKDKVINFNFRELQSKWGGTQLYPTVTGTAAQLGENEIENCVKGSTNPNKTWQYKVVSDDQDNYVTVTVDFTNEDAPVLVIEQEKYAAPQPSYYLHAGFLGNWDRNKRVKFEPLNGDTKVLVAKAVYKESNNGNYGFKVTNKKTEDNGIWWSLGGVMENGVAADIYNVTATANTTLPENALFQEVTYTLTLADDMQPKSLKAEWTAKDRTINDNIPVYPIGVYNDAAFKRYDQWPVMYLCGKVLNNNVVSPEYQMNQVLDDAGNVVRYELEFTARNTSTRDENSEVKDYQFYVMGIDDISSTLAQKSNKVSMNLKDSQWNDEGGVQKKDPNEGARMKAILTKSGDSWNLTFQKVGNINTLPFISMISENWKQKNNATTPYVKRDGSKIKNTDKGWEESWIQYDNRGQVLLDRKGRVMYNTMWPPRNPIFFKSEFEVDGQKKDFTLTSKDLTFGIQETKTGKEWKEDPRFANYNHEDHYLDNVYVHNNALALVDGKKYTLYTVDDMWINGKVKIWSGWSGVTMYEVKNDDNSTSYDVANWTYHTNWGHFAKVRDNNWTDKPPLPVEAGSTIPLYNEWGDMIFDKPTFFKHVNFFYEVDAPSEYGHSVIFTELAMGGAQIAAMSSHNYTVGNYQPALNYLKDVKDGYLKKVVIRSYATSVDGDNTNDEIVAEVFSWTPGTNETVKNVDFYTLFNSQDSNEELPGNGGYDSNNYASTGKWVKDPTSYTNGDYFYRMEVILTEDAAGTKEHTVIVDSNPFTIFNTQEKLTLNVYQLVKIPARSKQDENGIWTGTYVTFRGTVDNPTTPTLPAYELTIYNDDKFEGGQANFEYDENGDLANGYIDDTNYEFKYKSLSAIPTEEYENQNNQFTDKVLIVGSVPSANNIEGYAYAANNANGQDTPPPTPTESDETETPASVISKNGPVKAPMTEEYDRSCQRSEYGDRFMHVTNVGSFEQRAFDLKMKYSGSFIDADGEKQEYSGTAAAPTATYVAVVPEPVLKDARIQVFYGDDPTTATDDDKMDFEFRGLTLKDAHYTSIRDSIAIDYPNVSTYLQERMIHRDFFSIKIDNSNIGSDDENYADEVWGNVFEFGTDPDSPDGVVLGNFMRPQMFSDIRSVRLVRKPGYNYIKRWTSQYLRKLEMTDYAPIEFDHVLKQDENGNIGKIYSDEDGNVISEFTVLVKHDKKYEPHPVAANLDQADNLDHDRHNYIFHKDQNDQTMKWFEHLRHHGANDYYYVAIVEKSEARPGLTDDEDAIYVDATGKKLHFVVPASDLIVKTGGEGYEIPVKVKYDSHPDIYAVNEEGEQYITWDYLQWLKSIGTTDHFSKNLQVYVSYLYPFNETAAPVPTTPEAQNGPARVISDYSGNVLKSQAAVQDLGTGGNGVITEVENIMENAGYLNTGAGYIEVEGANVSIINAAGIVVGEGSGRHDVPAGVYVVIYNGKTVKVVVR